MLQSKARKFKINMLYLIATGYTSMLSNISKFNFIENIDYFYASASNKQYLCYY